MSRMITERQFEVGQEVRFINNVLGSDFKVGDTAKIHAMDTTTWEQPGHYYYFKPTKTKLYGADPYFSFHEDDLESVETQKKSTPAVTTQPVMSIEQQVWVQAWNTVAAERCADKHSPTTWANQCLKDFRKEFGE